MEGVDLFLKFTLLHAYFIFILKSIFKKHLYNTAQNAKRKIFLGVAAMFASTLAKTKPLMTLKKLSDKSIHAVFESEVGNWTYFVSQFAIVDGFSPSSSSIFALAPKSVTFCGHEK